MGLRKTLCHMETHYLLLEEKHPPPPIASLKKKHTFV